MEELVNEGLDEIVKKGQLDKDTVCLIGELIDVRKDLATMEAMEDAGYSEGYPMYYMDDGMSYARGGRGGSSRGRGSYARRGGSYERGGSYARGGGSYARGGYSRDDDKEEMIESLEEAMENATSEHDRAAIQRMIMKAEGR